MRVLGLIVLAGCDLVFSLDDDPDVDAGIDATAPDAPPTCTRQTLTAVLLEDTSLVPSICGGANRTGKATNINLGQEGNSRVLLRFSLTPQLVAAFDDDVVVGGSLTIAPRPNDCACTNAPTNFQVHVATDAWNEGTGGDYSGADYCNRIGVASGNQTPWQVDGADGSSDRSQIALATRAVSATEVALFGSAPPIIAPITTDFTVDAQMRAELRAFAIDGRLSLLLRPTAGGTLFLYSRESLSTSATLTFDECR
jgi:hypothetical protein